MARITVGDQEYTYDRLGKNRSETIYELVVVAESRTGDVTVRRIQTDAESRGDLTTDAVEATLQDWQRENRNLTVERFVIRETDSCGAGERVEQSEAEAGGTDTAEPASASAGGGDSTFYRGGSASQSTVGFGNVPVDPGEEVTFHVAGPDSSVYGTDTGTVTDVKAGTDGFHVLVVETARGTKRIREEWLIDDDETEDGDETEDEAEAETQDEDEANAETVETDEDES